MGRLHNALLLVVFAVFGCGQMVWDDVTHDEEIEYAKTIVNQHFGVNLNEIVVMATYDEQLLQISCQSTVPVWGCFQTKYQFLIRNDSQMQNCQTALHEYIHEALKRTTGDQDLTHRHEEFVTLLPACDVYSEPTDA